MADVPSARPIKPDQPAESDWTDQVTDLVVDVVDRVHDATTGRIIGVAKAVVYGTVALFAGLAVLILGIILVGHLLDRLPGQIWIPDLAIGAALVLAGLFLWSRRRAPAT
jgi:hypothetical protein